MHDGEGLKEETMTRKGKDTILYYDTHNAFHLDLNCNVSPSNPALFTSQENREARLSPTIEPRNARSVQLHTCIINPTPLGFT